MKNFVLSILLLLVAVSEVRGHCAITGPLFTTATISNGGQNPENCVGPGNQGTGSSGNRNSNENACYTNNPPNPRPQFSPGETFSFDVNCNGHNDDGFTFIGVQTTGNIDSTAPPGAIFDQTFNPATGGNIVGGAGGIEQGIADGRGSQFPLSMPGNNPVSVTLPNDMPIGRAWFELWTVEAAEEGADPNLCCGNGDWFSTTTIDVCASNTIQNCPANTCTILANGNGLGVNGGASACDADVICAPADGIGQCDQNGMVNGVCTNGMCECVPDADPCGNAVCGMVNDGCGNFMSCGDCVDPTPFCTVGTCTATECIPDTDCITDSNDPQCGVISDGCAASVDCGGCSAGEFDVCDASSSCVNAQGQTPSEAAAAGQSSSAVFLTFSAVLVSFLAFLLF